MGADAKDNHGRIASIIEQLFPDIARDRPALLAYHFAKAGTTRTGCRVRPESRHEPPGQGRAQEAIVSFNQGLDSVAGIAHPTAATTRLEMLLCAGRGVSIQTARGYTDPLAGRDWARATELSKVLAPAARPSAPSAGCGRSTSCEAPTRLARSSVPLRSGCANNSSPPPPMIRRLRSSATVVLPISSYYGGLLTAGRASAGTQLAVRDSSRTVSPTPYASGSSACGHQPACADSLVPRRPVGRPRSRRTLNRGCRDARKQASRSTWSGWALT